MMRRLLIDDHRTFGEVFCYECWDAFGNSLYFPDMIKDPSNYFQEATGFDSGMLELKDHGVWDELYLDNNLGEGAGRTGYDILMWLVQPENKHLIPKTIIIVSGCPDAIKRMQGVIDSFGLK